MLSLLLALGAGVVTIAAPCTLPVLPILLGASLGRASTARPAMIALGFVISFTAIALLLGRVTQAIGFDPEVLRDGATVLLVVFGLLMIWPAPFEWTTVYLRGLIGSRAGGAPSKQGNLSGFVLGTTLGLVWTPCAGPVLGSILTLVAAAENLTRAAVLLVCYAIGAGIPMLGIADGGQYVSTRIRRLARHAHRLQQAFGALVILIAVAMHLQYDSLVAVWLSNFYPATPGL